MSVLVGPFEVYRTRRGKQLFNSEVVGQTCVICQETLETPQDETVDAVSSYKCEHCKHRFHASCARQWWISQGQELENGAVLSAAHRCPLCKQEWPPLDFEKPKRRKRRPRSPELQKICTLMRHIEQTGSPSAAEKAREARTFAMSKALDDEDEENGLVARLVRLTNLQMSSALTTLFRLVHDALLEASSSGNATLLLDDMIVHETHNQKCNVIPLFAEVCLKERFAGEYDTKEKRDFSVEVVVQGLLFRLVTDYDTDIPKELINGPSSLFISIMRHADEPNYVRIAEVLTEEFRYRTDELDETVYPEESYVNFKDVLLEFIDRVFQQKSRFSIARVLDATENLCPLDVKELRAKMLGGDVE